MDAILVATDGSETARGAVRFAIDLARDTGAALHVLSVGPPTLHGHGGPPQPRVPVHEVSAAMLVAEAAVREAAEAGVTAQAHDASGDEAEAIVETAERLGAGMIVLGSHGHGRIGAALMGSVSRAVVKRSRIPVTIVPATVRADG